MGVSQENALQSVNNFLKAGLSVDLLPQLAAAAKDLAPTMAMSFNEAFEAIIQSVTKGTPKALAELTPGIKQAMQAASSETKKLMDSTILSGTEMSKIMVDFVLAAGAKMQGAGASTAGTYLKQINDYEKAVKQVKMALFEIVKPISMAITGSEIKSWQDLYVWVVLNKTALQGTAKSITELIQTLTSTAKAVGAFIWQYKELGKILLEVYLLSKAAGWFIGVIGGISAATAGVVGLGAKLTALRLALSTPWGLVIAVSLVGMQAALEQVKRLATTHPEYVGGAEWVPDEEYKAQGLEAGRKAKYKPATAGEPSPFGGVWGQQAEVSDAEAQAQARAAALKALQENKLPTKGGGKGGGKTGAEEDLVGEYQKMLEQKRQAEIQDATSSLEILKATNEKKRSELAKDLAEGLIDGQTYYAQLQALEAGETAASLALIEQKRTAQAAAYAAALAEVDRQDLSPEMAEYRRYEEGLKNRMALSTLDVEAAKAKLDGEKKVTDELKRQFEQSQNNAKTLQNLKLDSAWGPIEEQEAKLIKLKQEWDEAKAAALKSGYTADQMSQLDATYTKKTSIAQFGDQAKAFAEDITSGITSITDAMISGGSDLKSAANSMFKSLFKDGFKPGLDSLKDLLMTGFKDLFGAVGASFGNALMGVIGLVGMLLTKSTSSSYTASSLSSSVTTHEVVRGVVAGETSIDVAKISTALDEVMAPHLSALRSIEKNTRGGTSSSSSESSGTSITINAPSYDQLKKWLDTYFQDYLMTGAKA